jgi:histidinol-phosphatase (PHP family)
MATPIPLDAHLHTDLSPDANVPIDAFAGLARQQGVAEIAITDHVDFEPGDPAFAYSSFEERERSVRDAAERWDGRPAIRFGVEITYARRLEAEIREYLAAHAYDYVIGSVHPSVRGPMGTVEDAAAWCAGRTHREASAWYWDEVEGAIRSELFDTIGHVDFVKRYMYAHLGPFEYGQHADIYDRVLTALVETGTALEVNSSGLRQQSRETYPGPEAVERFRALGGERIVAGSDAHRLDQFGYALADAYRTISRAGFTALSFRRGGKARVRVDLAMETAAAAATDTATATVSTAVAGSATWAKSTRD